MATWPSREPTMTSGSRDPGLGHRGGHGRGSARGRRFVKPGATLRRRGDGG